MQQPDRPGSQPDSGAPAGYSPIAATDAIELTEQVRNWNFEFTQLKPGRFTADGVVIDLGILYIGFADIRQTLQHRGHAPHGALTVFVPGRGSGTVFAHGQQVDAGQCITLSEGASLEGVTHERYVDVAIAFNKVACQPQIAALNDGSFGIGPGTTIAAPGVDWTGGMQDRIDWLCESLRQYPQALASEPRRLGLADQVLAAMARFDSAPVDTDSTTRAARATRRVAVRLARDLIHSRLTEPMRISELCRHSRLKVRSLEYGFREVTGLTPVAYIRSLRLHTVRRALLDPRPTQPRSISNIAMDAGFWHLSQFASDYRRFFGEAPSDTRRRSITRRSEALTA